MKSLFLVAGTVAMGCAADIDSAALLARVQTKVLDNERRVPRYVCRQKLERNAFARIAPNFTISVIPSSCESLPERGLPQVRSLSLVLADRAHLDVMLARGKELFSWPGGGSFETDTPDDLLGGGLSGSGDFANFLISIFTSDKVAFEILWDLRRRVLPSLSL